MSKQCRVVANAQEPMSVTFTFDTADKCNELARFFPTTFINYEIIDNTIIVTQLNKNNQASLHFSYDAQSVVVTLAFRSVYEFFCQILPNVGKHIQNHCIYFTPKKECILEYNLPTAATIEEFKSNFRREVEASIKKCEDQIEYHLRVAGKNLDIKKEHLTAGREEKLKTDLQTKKNEIIKIVKETPGIKYQQDIIDGGVHFVRALQLSLPHDHTHPELYAKKTEYLSLYSTINGVHRGIELLKDLSTSQGHLNLLSEFERQLRSSDESEIEEAAAAVGAELASAHERSDELKTNTAPESATAGPGVDDMPLIAHNPLVETDAP